jgi:hypothetical protein
MGVSLARFCLALKLAIKQRKWNGLIFHFALHFSKGILKYAWKMNVAVKHALRNEGRPFFCVAIYYL